MNQGVSLLDEALSLARQEMAALADGAFDRAVELAERRQEVISMAWPVLADVGMLTAWIRSCSLRIFRTG